MMTYSSISKDDLSNLKRFEIACMQNCSTVVNTSNALITKPIEPAVISDRLTAENNTNCSYDDWCNRYGDRHTDDNDTLYADYRSDALYVGDLNDVICGGYTSLAWEWSAPFYEERNDHTFRNEWNNDAIYDETVRYYQLGEGRSNI